MQKIGVTLSVFFEGQYYTALFEVQDGVGYRACKKTFIAKPSDQQMLELVLQDYYTLKFTQPLRGETVQTKRVRNPKRRQREAAKATQNVCFSTKAQRALAVQREQNKLSKRSQTKKNKQQMADDKYMLRKQKRKQKHRGR